MNKRSLAIIIGLVIIVAGAIGWAYYSSSQEATRQNMLEEKRQSTQPSTPQPPSTPSTPDTPSRPGAYIDYSPNIIAKTSGIKVLFFHAPWCPQCRAIEADIKAQAKLPDNTTIIKVDYDSNQSLRQKYGVTLQTTFVRVNDDGELVKKYVAYNEPTFAALKEHILQ